MGRVRSVVRPRCVPRKLFHVRDPQLIPWVCSRPRWVNVHYGDPAAWLRIYRPRPRMWNGVVIGIQGRAYVMVRP